MSQIDKVRIKQKTGWSDKIVDYIRSMKEAQIYIDANLKEAEINGRRCLIRSDINMDYITPKGLTNRKLIESGKSPYATNGEKVELHHIGQKQDSPLVELTESEHRGKDNYSILHDAKKASEIDRDGFRPDREKHWKIRFIIGGY